MCRTLISLNPTVIRGKEGISKQEAKDQLGYCRSDVGANHLEKTQAQKLVSYCMKSKGYEIMEEYR